MMQKNNLWNYEKQLNCPTLFYALSSDANEEQLIEVINIETNLKRTLGTGADPVVSPDKQWIAFVHGKNEARQLWLMDRSGQNLKQISHVTDGLFPSNFFTKYIWSSDSKHIVLLYKQNYNYERLNIFIIRMKDMVL